MSAGRRAHLWRCFAVPVMSGFAATAIADAGIQTLPPVNVTGTASVAEKNQLPTTTESVTAEQITETMNVVNTEDALKYLPNVIVRKRHIGDVNSPMETRTSGLGQSARSLIYADGVLLSALIGNNNTSASPRWGMVAPQEIERVDVLYGPFAAAYAGNSIGTVVEIATRMPTHFEASAQAQSAWQRFSEYGTSGTYPAYQLGATLGNRVNELSYWLSASHVDSHGQPLAFVTAARSGDPSAAGTPVTGAYSDQNRNGAPIQVLGAGGFEHQIEDNFKFKGAYDFTPTLRAIYTFGLFHHDDTATTQTYLRDATGNQVYSGSVNIDGYSYGVAPSAFSNNLYRLKEDHFAQSVTLKTSTQGTWDWTAVASNYDFHNDTLRTPGAALPAAQSGGAGTITSLDGTGWTTLDAKAFWRPREITGAHQASFGAHYDFYKLVSPKYSTSYWISGDEGVLSADARGKTATAALWMQDAWRFLPGWKATLGGRYEQWRAFDGQNYSLAPFLAVVQPGLSASRFSPKASLAWDGSQQWIVTGNLGVAYRFPTVSELYQAISTGPNLTVPNPNLRPEHALSGELAAERSLPNGRVRFSLFQENLEDALISQTAPLVPGSSSLFSYVQNVDRIRSQGVELVADVNDVLVKGLQLSGSVTYVRSRILEDAAFPAAVGKQTSNIPPWRWTLVASYRPNDKLTATLAARYSSRVYSTIDNSDVYTHTYQGFDSFLVVDARLHYRFDKNWSGAVGVDNLNNRRYFLFHAFPQRTALAEIRFTY